MELREQIEKELIKLSKLDYDNSFKSEIASIIKELKKNDSPYKVTKINDPLVKVFIILSRNKKYHEGLEVMIQIIRVLVEFGAIDGQACEGVFNEICSHIGVLGENFDMKILQVAMSSFASPSVSLSQRITSMKWIFILTSSASQIVRQIATATLYQSVSVIIDKITTNKENKTEEETPEKENDEQSVESFESIKEANIIAPEQNFHYADESFWSVRLIFIVLTDVISSLIGESPLVFKDCIKSNGTTLYYNFVKYILDKYMTLLSFYKQKFNEVITKLIIFINSQKDVSLFAFFVPYVLLSIKQTNANQTSPIIEKMCSLMNDEPIIFVTINAIAMCDPYFLFDVISEEKTLQINSSASKYFFEHFNGQNIPPIKMSDAGKYKMEEYNSFNKSVTTILASCVSIIYLEVHQSIRHLKCFSEVFDPFVKIFETMIKSTNNTTTLSTSMKVSRIAAKIVVVQGNTQQSHNILSILCKMALPDEKGRLSYKGIIALNSVIKLLKFLTYRIKNSWPMIFETISKCFSSASNKETQQPQVVALISPSVLEFSENIKDEPFQEMFKFLLELAKKEVNAFIDGKEVSPNFWPHRSVCYLFSNNGKRIEENEDDFFDYLNFLLNCKSDKFREYATVTLFDIAKNLSSKGAAKSTRQKVFSIILSAAKSAFKDVSLSAFSSLFNFFRSGAATNIVDEWFTVFTTFRAIWVNNFDENIENGFKTLSIICRDYLKNVNVNVLNELISVTNTYVIQPTNAKISLGSINLFTDIASGIVPISGTDLKNVWKYLLTVIYNDFEDDRKLVRIAVVETFFRIISLFHEQFPDDLSTYAANYLLKPYFERISSEVNKSVKGVDNADEYLLALNSGIKVINYLENYQTLIPTIISTIEKLAMKVKNVQNLMKLINCYLILVENEDKEILNEITASIHRVINSFYSDNNNEFMQKTAPVVADMFKIVSNSLDLEHYQTWIDILSLFCTFKLDSKGLNESTNIALNAMINVDGLTVDKLCIVNKTVVALIELNNQQLSTKCFEILYHIYANLFNEDNRGVCLSQILFTFKRSLKSNEECFSCFKKIIELPVNLAATLKDNRNVKRLVDIGRRFPDFEKAILFHMAKYMDCISHDVLPIVISLVSDSPDLYITFINKFCAKGASQDKINFAKASKNIFFSEISSTISLILDEERSMGSILPIQRYACIATFLPEFIKTETEESIFEIEGCGNIGHLFMLVNDMVKLSESKNDEIRIIAQKIITIVNNKILSSK